jgi:hypothetical protein
VNAAEAPDADVPPRARQQAEDAFADWHPAREQDDAVDRLQRVLARLRRHFDRWWLLRIARERLDRPPRSGRARRMVAIQRRAGPLTEERLVAACYAELERYARVRLRAIPVVGPWLARGFSPF